MKKRKEFGKCCLCGLERELTFEHVPPEKAFNDKPIFIQGSEQLTDTESFHYGKKSRSNRGFGAYTLCISCNRKTGSWYAPAYIDFARQGMSIYEKPENKGYGVHGVYDIQPLNVLKQVLTMFMSADKSRGLSTQSDLVEFLLNKESQALPSRFSVYQYFSVSSTKRFIGYSVIGIPGKRIQKWSEFNFQPFGFLLADDSDKAHEDMLDITSFSLFKYNQKAKDFITLPHLIIQGPAIGLYLNSKD